MIENFHAPHPIRRPYTPLFMHLRDRVTALMEQMDPEADERVAPGMPSAGGGAVAVPPELILARIDWTAAAVVFCWGVDDDAPVRVPHSLDFTLDLGELKGVALDTPMPRAYFESYALYLVAAAQRHFGAFFRDGPTDDIPYNRYEIYVAGMDGASAPCWISTVLFTYEEPLP